MDNIDNNYNMNNNYNNINNVRQNPTFTKYLVMSIIQLACCSQITGILGLVFTILANDAYNKDNVKEYEKNTNYAKTSLTVGFVIGAILVISYTVLIVLSIILEMAQSL